jgi:hypothetical protein
MKTRIFFCALTSIALSACGGGSGGGSGDSGSTTFIQPDVSGGVAQGLYNGTDSAGDLVSGIILDTGAFYFLYVNQTANTLGLLQGTASRATGSLGSTDARSYLIAQNSAAGDSVSFSYVAQSSLSGTVYLTAGGSAPVTFNANYSPVYDQAPSLANIAGTYSGVAGSIKGVDTVTVTIGATGAVSGQGVSGCVFNGSAAPHGSKNVYDTSITFGGAPCLYPGRTLTGVLSVNNNALLAAAPLADRTDAFVLTASK